jgi:hypothetical protein
MGRAEEVERDYESLPSFLKKMVDSAKRQDEAEEEWSARRAGLIRAAAAGLECGFVVVLMLLSALVVQGAKWLHSLVVVR